ncbi:MAG: transporter substrate-binding domain-containing protein [Coriobacteriia bacterium]|nr:transporter substrate-binding domain-containing protein [Coriobacteriia bacterium]
MTDFSRRNFLKLSGLSTLTVAGATFLTGCGPAAQSSDSSSSSSSDSSTSSSSGVLGDGKTLRVGMEAAYAPYNWQEEKASDTTIPIENVSGAYADGYDVQIAKKIAEGLGMEPVAVKMEFGALVDSLNNGTIDIICAGMSVTPERSQSADFTDSYIDDEVVMVVKQDSKYADATKLSDFDGATVLGQKDTFYDDLIDEIPNVNHLTPVATVPLVVDGIENGTCDAITFSSMSLPNLLQNYPDLKKVELAEGDGFSDPSNPDNAAIAKGQDDILAKLNEIIGGISEADRLSIWQDCMDRQPA